MTCEINHIPRPKPINVQNVRAFGLADFMFDRKAPAAQKRIAFCRMSPKAVSGKLRRTTRDNTIWTHTTVHTMVAHFRLN